MVAKAAAQQQIDITTDWSVDINLYEQSMAVTGAVSCNDKMLSDTLDVVGAFVNGECRGVAHITRFPLTNMYQFDMLIYGQEDEQIQFRVLRS
ncbi:hypothetical protein JXA70_05250 [candidate division KSB1 bacterium]|nr:hypothetical protein [candidate division KSB1 bacterium]